MEAKEHPLNYIIGQTIYKIPFSQRSYVWYPLGRDLEYFRWDAPESRQNASKRGRQKGNYYCFTTTGDITGRK